jgi:hypothetical protein
MGHFVYVSHRDVVEALTVSKELVASGHYPFVPQLNRLVAGRSDKEWENYFKMWLFRCDCIYLTPSYREHELAWASENSIPRVFSMRELERLTLPPFGELGRKFGEKCAEKLPSDESWRKLDKAEARKHFEGFVGLGRDPVEIGSLCLCMWDRQAHG